MAIETYGALPDDCKQRLRDLHKELDSGEISQKNYINHLLGELDEFLPDTILDKLSEAKTLSKKKTIDKEEFTKRVLDILSCYKPSEDDMLSQDGKENEEESMEAENQPDLSSVKIEKTPGRAAKLKGQLSITSMFDSMASKRKSSSSEAGIEKKMKTEAPDSKSLRRCPDCRQYLDDDLLSVQDIPGGVEEFITLTNPELSIYEDDSSAATDERLMHKITNFSVFGKCRHLCPFDDGLIEKNKELFFCGYVKPVYVEDSSTDGGFPTVMMGPINEWFVHGFDGYFPIIGFSTAFSDYYLMEPSEIYQPFMTVVREKTFMSNLVISFLLDNGDATYEDLLLKLESAELPKGVTCALSEDTLVRHAQFVCDQIQSFDFTADSDEELLITCPCIKSLIKLAGVTLGTKLKRKMVKAPVKKEKGHATQTLATTTPLVTYVFNTMFESELDDSAATARRKRCGQCEICLQPDCGKCVNCKNMVKFGGDGKAKQACMMRRCPNMAVAVENDADEEEEDEMDKKAMKTSTETKSKRKIMAKSDKKAVKFVGDCIETIKSTEYYSGIKIQNEVYSLGDYVSVPDAEKPDLNDIGRIEYIYKNSKGEGILHVHWFTRATDTVLGETSDPKELFFVDECDDITPENVEDKATVIHHKPSKDWFEMGGMDDGESPVPKGAENTYFYQLWYDPVLARYEDVPHVENTKKTAKFCDSCVRLAEASRKEKMIVGEKLDSSSDSKTQYASVEYQGDTYQIGDCMFLDPDSFVFKYKKTKKSTAKDLASMYEDEDKYPEVYRRSNTYVKGSNDECPDPFLLARILEIYKKDPKEDEVFLKVAKFYRPENTHMKDSEVCKTDLNMVYWSEELSRVRLCDSNGKIKVIYIPAKDMEKVKGKILKEELFARDTFYFTEAYNGEEKEFYKPPKEAKDYMMDVTVDNANQEPEFKKLRCLDVFAGCGGLSAGLHQCGVAESRWAIEKVDAAARAYSRNSENCTVFTDDCNLLLKLVMEGETTNNKGQLLPQKGEVEMLCGGPPCQGFSGMNRFNSREYSRFKNSLIASYLSYCDYYRPRFFILENVRNFVSYKNCMVLKSALRCLVAMGYQCTFGVMQAGCYGVAQTRRRAIIMAAAPGEKLPFYPEPMHVFAPKALQLNVVINDVKYSSNIKHLHSAPYRTITVRDCMSDLPEIKNGHKTAQMDYSCDAETHFQRLIRDGQTTLTDHVCKEMNPLVAARMSYIPTYPGSDWRLLPNIEVKLSDGTKSKLLKYTHKDMKNGKSGTGALRGVCSCATGAKCDSEFRQFNTLIPWCLPHTGNRHNHWAGLYGRLEWDGFFSTTVTNPEPMGKQGRVLHPEQHRVVSVRECARSQGFPDSFQFYGTILDKHRQVGNAVPPPLGKALGQEVKKSVIEKIKSANVKNEEK